MLAVAAVLDLVDVDGAEGLRTLQVAGLAIWSLRAAEKVAACVFLLHFVSLHGCIGLAVCLLLLTLQEIKMICFF